MVKKVLFLFAVFLFALFGISEGERVWAAEGLKEVTITSELSWEEKENFRPDAKLVDESGKELWLKEWRIEPLFIEERKKWAEHTVDYEEVEWMQSFPKEAPLSVKDHVTGQIIKENLPVYQMDERNERWIPGFSFTAIFYSYDADYYMLGEKKIPYDEERPQIDDCHKELFHEIQVDPYKYRITDALWEGDPYIDDTGVLCRNAIITGEKKVSDYHVTYGGEVVIPSFWGSQCVAVYQGFESLTDAWDQMEAEKVSSEDSMGYGGVEKREFMIFRKSVIAVVSVLLIMVGILLFLLLRKLIKCRKKEEDTRDDEVYW